MKIIIAQTAGFCMGVHRVVNLAVDMMSNTGQEVYSLGPLIHNNQTLEMLHDRGIKMYDTANPPPANATLLIRAHGVPLDMQEQLAQRYTIIDGTCPKVKTVHRVITKYRDNGYAIVITGDKGHAEVIGLLGYAGKAGHLIQNTEDVESLPYRDKICVVSQTTFNRNTFDEIAALIKKKFQASEVIIKKTICATTDKRQTETHDLAKKVDAMIVVGGKNSANTLRLAKISGECGTPTYHIETEQEIKWEHLAHCNTIGITAGASTPGWMIRRVVDHLHFLDRTTKKNAWGKLLQLFEILANTNFFIAAGGVAMYYASTVFQELPFKPVGAVIASLYLFSIYLWNSLACIEKNKHLDISRYRFYNANKTRLTVLALGCIITLLAISLGHSGTLFYLMLVPTFAGSIYQFSIVPRPLRKFVRYGNLKDFPTSRDLFAALAWAVLITFIPQVIHNAFIIKPVTIAMFLWTFFLAYVRSLIFDLRDIEGDRIMGRETLITIIGEQRAKRLIYSALAASFLVLLTFFILSFMPEYRFSNAPYYTFLFQIPVLIHVWFFMKLQHKLRNTLSPLFNILVDGQFFIAGLGAWIVTLLS